MRTCTRGKYRDGWCGGEQIEPMKPEEEENKLEAFEGDGSSHLLSLKPAFLRSSSAVLASPAVLVARVRARA